MQIKEDSFSAPDGTGLYRLSALPASDIRARVALVPGYGDHGRRYLACLRYLAERGVAAHALDFRGQGLAEGRRAYAERWEDYGDDLAAFLSLEAVTTPEGTPLFVLAQSHGALVTILSVIRNGLPGVRGCIFTAPYLSNKAPTPRSKLLLAKFANQALPFLAVPTEVPADWMTSDPQMLAEDQADPLALHIATPRWFITMQTAQAAALERASEFDLPLLLLTGAEDNVADNAAAAAFFQRAGTPDKTFAELSPCRHEPLRETHRERHYDLIFDWLCQRL